MPDSLKKSMLYSLQAGGKRLRPLIVLAVLNAYGKSEKDGIPVGCAVEMIHTYSLIHDDLHAWMMTICAAGSRQTIKCLVKRRQY